MTDGVLFVADFREAFFEWWIVKERIVTKASGAAPTSKDLAGAATLDVKQGAHGKVVMRILPVAGNAGANDDTDEFCRAFAVGHVGQFYKNPFIVILIACVLSGVARRPHTGRAV